MRAPTPSPRDRGPAPSQLSLTRSCQARTLTPGRAVGVPITDSVRRTPDPGQAGHSGPGRTNIVREADLPPSVTQQPRPPARKFITKPEPRSRGSAQENQSDWPHRSCEPLSLKLDSGQYRSHGTIPLLGGPYPTFNGSHNGGPDGRNAFNEISRQKLFEVLLRLSNSDRRCPEFSQRTLPGLCFAILWSSRQAFLETRGRLQAGGLRPQVCQSVDWCGIAASCSLLRSSEFPSIVMVADQFPTCPVPVHFPKLRISVGAFAASASP
eukprot:728213-Hanusia_phi.AAC.1